MKISVVDDLGVNGSLFWRTRVIPSRRFILFPNGQIAGDSPEVLPFSPGLRVNRKRQKTLASQINALPTGFST